MIIDDVAALLATLFEVYFQNLFEYDKGQYERTSRAHVHYLYIKSELTRCLISPRQRRV